MIPPVGSVLPRTPTRWVEEIGGIGPTGGRSSRSCGGKERGVSSTRWATGVPAAGGGARSTRTCCVTPSRRSCWSMRGGGHPSRPSVERWLSFFTAPSAQAWYAAHNASVVAGYLAHSELAALEAPAERFFMNVVLVRVLYAQALVARRRTRARPAVLPGTTGRAPSVAGPAGPVVDERRSARSVSDRWRRGGGDHRQGEPAGPDDGLRRDQRTRRRSVRFLCTRLR